MFYPDLEELGLKPQSTQLNIDDSNIKSYISQYMCVCGIILLEVFVDDSVMSHANYV